MLGQDDLGLAEVRPVERMQRVTGQELVDAGMVERAPVGGAAIPPGAGVGLVFAHVSSVSRKRRSFCIAARVLVFTVPKGMCSSWAIAAWVIPPK